VIDRQAAARDREHGVRDIAGNGLIRVVVVLEHRL
jgi:hypothetical protein